MDIIVTLIWLVCFVVSYLGLGMFNPLTIITGAGLILNISVIIYELFKRRTS